MSHSEMSACWMHRKYIAFILGKAVIE